MSKKEEETRLFWWMVQNYVDYKKGCLDPLKVKKLERTSPNWIKHYEGELAKMGLFFKPVN